MQFYKHWVFFFWGCNVLHWRICFPATTLCRDHSRAPLTAFFLPGKERNGEALIHTTYVHGQVDVLVALHIALLVSCGIVREGVHVHVCSERDAAMSVTSH